MCLLGAMSPSPSGGRRGGSEGGRQILVDLAAMNVDLTADYERWPDSWLWTMTWQLTMNVDLTADYERWPDSWLWTLTWQLTMNVDLTADYERWPDSWLWTLTWQLTMNVDLTADYERWPDGWLWTLTWQLTMNVDLTADYERWPDSWLWTLTWQLTMNVDLTADYERWPDSWLWTLTWQLTMNVDLTADYERWPDSWLWTLTWQLTMNVDLTADYERCPSGWGALPLYLFRWWNSYTSSWLWSPPTAMMRALSTPAITSSVSPLMRWPSSSEPRTQPAARNVGWCEGWEQEAVRWETTSCCFPAGDEGVAGDGDAEGPAGGSWPTTFEHPPPTSMPPLARYSSASSSF